MNLTTRVTLHEAVTFNGAVLLLNLDDLGRARGSLGHEWHRRLLESLLEIRDRVAPDIFARPTLQPNKIGVRRFRVSNWF